MSFLTPVIKDEKNNSFQIKLIERCHFNDQTFDFDRWFQNKECLARHTWFVMYT